MEMFKLINPKYCYLDIGTGAGSSSRSTLEYLKGAKKVGPRLMEDMSRIYKAGAAGTPQTQMLQQLAANQAAKELGTQRRQLAETEGLTSPAKAAIAEGLGEAAIPMMAQVPLATWEKALAFLQDYMKPVGTETRQRTTEGSGFKLLS